MKKLLSRALLSLPQSLVVAINCRRRRNFWQERGIIFVHVPKAAGTSISHSLYGRSLGHLKATEIRHWAPREFASLYKFAFVRNPWDRAVSAYRFALAGATATAGMHTPGRYRGPAFRTFETFVHDWLVQQDLTKTDYVFQPQHLFVSDKDGSLLVNFLGKVEDLERDIIRLEESSGVRLVIPELNRLSPAGDYRNYYANSDLINAVGDLYRRDIALVNYDY